MRVKRKRIGGAALMLAAATIMASTPATTRATTQEVGVLQQVYGFGTWTAVGFGLVGVAVCGVATVGVGISVCGAAAVI